MTHETYKIEIEANTTQPKTYRGLSFSKAKEIYNRIKKNAEDSNITVTIIWRSEDDGALIETDTINPTKVIKG